MGCADKGGERSAGGGQVSWPGREDQEVGAGDACRTLYVVDDKSLGGPNGTTILGPHGGVPPRGQAQAADLAEHEQRRGEVKHRHAVERVHADLHLGLIPSKVVSAATHASGL